MPHLFAHRPRAHHLGKPANECHDVHHNWEMVNAYVYLFGGVIFILGSLMLYPQFAVLNQYAGWVFVSGSLIFFVVSAHDLLEVIHFRRYHGELDAARRHELAAAVSYVFGGSAYLAGRIMFIASDDLVPVGAWFFIFGSVMFLIGGCVNVAQILDAKSLRNLQMLNATAITYLTGSLLFLVACVPYIWRLPKTTTGLELLSFMATEFLIGSALFLIGGLVNLIRVRRPQTGESERLVPAARP